VVVLGAARRPLPSLPPAIARTSPGGTKGRRSVNASPVVVMVGGWCGWSCGEAARKKSPGMIFGGSSEQVLLPSTAKKTTPCKPMAQQIVGRKAWYHSAPVSFFDATVFVLSFLSFYPLSASSNLPTPRLPLPSILIPTPLRSTFSSSILCLCLFLS